MQAYRGLQTLFTQLYHLKHLVALAGWDAQVNSPPNTFEARGLAIAELENHMHTLVTSASTQQLIADACGSADELGPVDRANLREMARIVAGESCLPAELLTRKTVLTTNAQAVWAKSRQENNFAGFQPVLKELVELAREEGGYRAAAMGAVNQNTHSQQQHRHQTEGSGSSDTARTTTTAAAQVSPYEALLDVFEPGMTVARLDTVFNDVKTWLPNLLQEVRAKQSAEDAKLGGPPAVLKGPYSRSSQQQLSRHVMENVWRFDFTRGRLDESAHPFTGNVKEDCRITTHYAEDSFIKALYGVIHETGHAKYEMNMGPVDPATGLPSMPTQPVSQARSLGVHESQSLLAEKMIGRSAAFVGGCVRPLLLQYMSSPTDSAAHAELSALSETELCRLVQRVEPGYIRVEADEVCYPLHVILRYELERDLMEGRLEAEDVPRAWNEKMKAYLGLETLGRDDVGCLQDIHWAGGMLGYFPTYSLGAMFAAQLMATIKKELGDGVVDKCLRTGDLAPILAKQKEKIWDHGSTLTTDELMVKATGETLNPEYLRKHLEARYLHGES